MQHKYAHYIWRFVIVSASTFAVFYFPLEQVFDFHLSEATFSTALVLSLIILWSEMYFVLSGNLLITDNQHGGGNVITELNERDFFGEMALFRNQPRSATVKALTYCELYYLNKTTFDIVLNRYPDIAEKIRAKVEKVESEVQI